LKVQKNRLVAVYLLPCGGSTPGGQICGNALSVNNAPESEDLQVPIWCLRVAIQFRMKKGVTAFHLF
jgi:hypothetical protein